MAGWFPNLSLDNIGAQVTGLTQSFGESATKMGEDIQQKVNSLAAFDLEDIGKVIQDAEEDIVAEETKIKQADAGLRQAEVKILPWETRVEQKAILSHDLMEKVLSLSLEETNFTTALSGAGAKPETQREPSQGTIDADGVRYATDTPSAPAFELERYTNVAIKMLSLDPNLAKVHSRLISRMPEKTFWHHYFSRVADLRAEVGLEPLCEDLRQDASGTSTSEEYDKVSYAEAQSMNSPSDIPVKADHNSDDGDADDDYSDLGDLDDLDAGSDSSIDATLEAEIAAELGDG